MVSNGFFSFTRVSTGVRLPGVKFHPTKTPGDDVNPAARWKTQEHLHSLRGERHPVFFGLFFEVNTFTHFSKIIHSLSKMNGWFLNGRCSFTSLSRFSRVFCFFSQGKIPINQTSYHMLPGSRYTHNGIVPLKSVPMGIYWFCCVLWGFLRITTHKYPLIFFFRGGPTLGLGYIPFSPPPPSPGSKKRSLRCVKSEPSRDLKTGDIMGIEGSYDQGLLRETNGSISPKK